MRTPHFVRLVEIDEHRFISACRHGLIHLTWGRLTVRFARDEFRRVAALLARAVDGIPPSFVRDAGFRATYREEEECELRIGPLALLLNADEFVDFAEAAGDAIRRLDEILDSGMWDREEEADDGPDSLPSPFRGTRFSDN
jgi:hypothetical protein